MYKLLHIILAYLYVWLIYLNLVFIYAFLQVINILHILCLCFFKDSKAQIR